MAKIVAPERKKKRKQGTRLSGAPALARVGASAVLGAISAVLVGMLLSWDYTPLVFWDVTALFSGAMLWLALRTMDAGDTEEHATSEDPGRAGIGIIMLLASIASLAGVVVLIIQGTSATGFLKILDVCLGVVSIGISWVVVHLMFMLRYADLYFKDGDGIDFNTDAAPTYQDFAYVAFTIGMTYQVSDTSLKTSDLRTLARQHALISYVFGTAIIAMTINAVVGLVK